MMRRLLQSFLLVSALCFAVTSGRAASNDDPRESAYWKYPGSTSPTEAHGRTTIGENTSAKEEISIAATSDSLKQVVRYYCNQVGFTPPNWSILGRDFPGDKSPPALWTSFGKLNSGEPARIVLTHDIRADVAQVTFLVQLPDTDECICVSISRAKDESLTSIQVLLIAK